MEHKLQNSVDSLPPTQPMLPQGRDRCQWGGGYHSVESSRLGAAGQDFGGIMDPLAGSPLLSF